MGLIGVDVWKTRKGPHADPGSIPGSSNPTCYSVVDGSSRRDPTCYPAVSRVAGGTVLSSLYSSEGPRPQ